MHGPDTIMSVAHDDRGLHADFDNLKGLECMPCKSEGLRLQG